MTKKTLKMATRGSRWSRIRFYQQNNSAKQERETACAVINKLASRTALRKFWYQPGKECRSTIRRVFQNMRTSRGLLFRAKYDTIVIIPRIICILYFVSTELCRRPSSLRVGKAWRKWNCDPPKKSLWEKSSGRCSFVCSRELERCFWNSVALSDGMENRRGRRGRKLAEINWIFARRPSMCMA